MRKHINIKNIKITTKFLLLILSITPHYLKSQISEVFISSGEVNSSSNHVATGNIDLDPAPELVYLRGTEFLYIIDGITGVIEWENGDEYSSISISDNPIYDIGDGNNFLTFRARVDDSYWVISIGEVAGLSINQSYSRPSKSSIDQNYPNPFNPNTRLEYTLFHASNTIINIYDINGREIKSFESKFQQAGTYSLNWDGTNNRNASVSAGIYFGQLVTDKNIETIKMILVK
jgi:hypothetical protein